MPHMTPFENYQFEAEVNVQSEGPQEWTWTFSLIVDQILKKCGQHIIIIWCLLR